ncbi:bromodomain adjacent to zinc finger domain protein 2B-like [Zingiber officinale]|uniref:Myb/SANT-like DNA-binding domain-containing protein n=1 Tax=Zingiber officinale TaxID=94328 RepID=A0A8J5GF76_ZINOF|nr:bromodomain adjacent to zinc finger domain protein 2B-like [Zingiber officinale]KAG6506351.1 hypothetical protein ZIOFF_031674 [Zingiber officinale]
MDHGVPEDMMPSNMGSGVLLGLDMSLHPHQQQMQQQPKLHHQLAQQPAQQPAHQMLHFQSAGDVAEHRPLGRRGQYLSPFARDKQQPPAQTQQQHVLSSEEEPGYGEAEPADDPAARRSLTQQPPPASLWQRMKWTDSMVRLLVQVVYRVGDDGGAGAESEQQQMVAGKGKSKAGTAAALLQKKGKWKSVSREMMEKGFSVSPQQCEDKFNDLNKRYKRVNDLLGKGTACRVVENQALLDTMDHLSPKAKEEARKLLNSKHLFFREMCAYHHAGGGGSCTAAASAPPPPSQQVPPPPHQDPQQRHLCFHHPQGSRSDGTGVVASRALAVPTATDEEGMMMGDEVDDDDDVDSEDEDGFDVEDDEDDEDLGDGNNHKRRHHPHKHDEGEDEDSKELVAPGKKQRRASSQMSGSPPLTLTLSSQSGTMQQLRSELMAAMSTAGGGEQHQWLRKKAAELEEQRVAFQCRAFQLERQRFKWLRFCTNKEREMERTKLENERLCLENDRMLLLLRQKELELMQGGCGTANADHPSSSTA